VLPSESALALVIAHQLAHQVLGHRRVDIKLPDVLKISDAELLAKLKFRHTPAEEADADRLALQLLEQSPHSKAMEPAGLFM
jgi:predicted Zn-dependent protease